MTTQKRENHGEYNRVCQGGLEAGLTRLKDATRTWGESEEKPRAQREEEHSGYDEVCPGEHETHSLGDETVHEEEHEGVEHNGHLAGLSVDELDTLPVGGQENTWAERQKKGGWDRNFLGSDIWEHG